MTGTILRRGLAALAGLTTSCALLVSAASPAHALFTPCDSSTLPCITAVADNYTATFGTKLTVDAAHGLLANDTGGPGTKVDLSTFDSDTFLNGTVKMNADGSFSYTATTAGVDTFDYSLVETNGDSSDPVSVTITVKPVLGADSYSVAANHKLTVAAPGVLKNDVSVDAFSLLFDSTSAHHVVIFDDGNGAFDYTPPRGFSGVDTFHYKVDDADDDVTYTVLVTIHVTAPPPPPTVKPTGYWMVGGTGLVYPFGQVRNYGNAPTPAATHIEPTPSRRGYWVLDAYGRVFPFGDAHSYGRAPGLRPGEFARSLSSTPSGLGYWIFTDRGRVFARGDAHDYGDMSRVTLNGPVIGSATTPTGHGYYMVASDGGIFSFGDAHFYGSMGGTHLNQPVNGLVPTANNRGYWLVASDGGIFAFGNAGFHGSMGSTRLNRPIIGMVRYGNGYLMVSSDGGIFAFSNLPFAGSLGSNPPPVPIVGVASGG